MRRNRRTFGIGRLATLSIIGFCFLFMGSLCKEPVPTDGVFPIKVLALTSDKVGIAKAQVLVNKKKLGETDKYGAFVGTYSGKVGEKIWIKVVAKGVNNFIRVGDKLKIRKTSHGWVPAEVKVQAYLRPATMEIDPAGGAGGGVIAPTPLAQGPGTKTPNADNPGGGASDTRTQPVRANRRVAVRRAAPVAPRRVDNDNSGGGSIAPPPRTVQPVVPRVAIRTAEPRFDGRYSITVSANVAGVRVSLRGRRSRSGTIRDANGQLKISYRDRSKTPRSVRVTFRIRRKSWQYKESKIVKTLELQYGQREYSVEAVFEKKPPRKISISANLADVKVYVNGKAIGVTTAADTPITFDYEGRSRSVRVELRAPSRKHKPRRHRTRVRFKSGVYEYTVQKSFEAPAPPTPRVDTPPPPVAKSSGKYKLTITSNVSNVYVYKGRRRIGYLRQVGSELSHTHKERKVPPRPLSIRFRAKDRHAYVARDVKQTVNLEAGREDNYRVEGVFEKRKPIRISVTSNAAGARVKLGRKVKGVTTSGQPLVLEYNGRPVRSLRIEVQSPNPRTFKPRRIRKTVRIQSGVSEYSVEATFTQIEVGLKPISPRCFRRKRGRKGIVTLAASPGTTLLLIGDCNNEQLAKTGRKGRILVRMPVGSFQRVRAIFPSGAKITKVFEVKRKGQSIRLVSGGKRCALLQIHKKVKNQIRLEREEVSCLTNVKKANPQYYASLLYLARYHCTKRRRSQGARVLNKIIRNPRNRFNPYRALQMGIELGRCKRYSPAIRLLKQAERLVNRIPPVDRYSNKKALYRSLSQIYEQRYYRQKNIVDLTRSLKLMERLQNIARSSDGATRSYAIKNVKRLKRLVAQRGGGLDE